jgi:hypothetical protein
MRWPWISTKSRPRQHTAWCDSNAPATVYGDRLACNCDPRNPNSASAYAFIEALRQFERADAEFQEALLGRQIRPPLSRGTPFEE